ncbi:FAD-binding oxidoreductase [Labrys okinawensis]|uniref:FAD-binding oxidoreductase n=1 Tax=Labrys okinawensis TaxID=346911 RepID=UPI0039BCDF6F
MAEQDRSLPTGFPEALAAIVGEAHLRLGERIRELDVGEDPDNLGASAVVSPASTAEVAAVVALCGRHGVPVVTHGGRTGLVGGGISVPGQVVLSTRRMNRIERLDPDERVAVVEAGCGLQALQDAALPHRLDPGIDLAARGTATIGGMVSTNAGGTMAFRNGVMRHRVLGLEAVLPDGSIYSDLTRVVKNAAGYDLKHLLIGAEGTLGIVTKAALKLEPLPAAHAVALFSFPSVAAALATLSRALAAGVGRLRAAEAMWASYFHYVARQFNWSAPGFDMSQAAYVIFSLDGADEEGLQGELAEILEDLQGDYPQITAVLAGSLAQEQAIWRLREESGVIYRDYPDSPSFDVSVPLSELDAYVNRITMELAGIEEGLAPFVFGHLADGNLHIMLNRSAEATSAPVLAAVEGVLYDNIRALGGSFSAEHGVGSKRIHALYATSDPVKLKLMQSIKQTLDPAGILNPGKVVDSARLRG